MLQCAAQNHRVQTESHKTAGKHEQQVLTVREMLGQEPNSLEHEPLVQAQAAKGMLGEKRPCLGPDAAPVAECLGTRELHEEEAGHNRPDAKDSRSRETNTSPAASYPLSSWTQADVCRDTDRAC